MSREVFHYTWWDEFSRYPIFVDGTFILHFVLLFVLRIRWRLHIGDAEPSYNFNTLWPRRNEQHFADDIFKRIFFNENIWISIKISLKLVPKGPIKDIHAWFRQRLGAVQATSHYLNQWWLIYRRIYASRSLDELRQFHCRSVIIYKSSVNWQPDKNSFEALAKRYKAPGGFTDG